MTSPRVPQRTRRARRRLTRRRRFHPSIPLFAALLFGAFATHGQAPSGQATSPPTFHQEFLDFEAVLSGKVTRLAEAIPADRFDWRPSDDVRSVGEVFVHLSRAAYGAASAAIGMSGGAPPFAAPDWATLRSKEEITETLDQCLRLARGIAAQMGEMDLSTAPGGPGTQSLRASLNGYLLHMSEHLGQLIAYSRSVGTTPPWSG